MSHEPASPDTVLVRYLALWEQRVRALQRRHPGRWCVRGWSDEEVRDALTLRLFEAAQSGDVLPRADGTGDEELAILAGHLKSLRRGSRLRVTVMDLHESPVIEREPSQEERYLDFETSARFAVAADRARASLNQPQRRWLAAMQWTANRGDFFEASDKLNLSAASRVIGKNRSSALRAYREIEARFREELERLE
jgi:hypothetical protein